MQKACMKHARWIQHAQAQGHTVHIVQPLSFLGAYLQLSIVTSGQLSLTAWQLDFQNGLEFKALTGHMRTTTPLDLIYLTCQFACCQLQGHMHTALTNTSCQLLVQHECARMRL